MLNFVTKLLSSPVWRIQMEARQDELEARLGALVARFDRLQAREGMAKARAAKEVTRSLEEQVETLLSDPDAAQPVLPGAPDKAKLDLWRKRH